MGAASAILAGPLISSAPHRLPRDPSQLEANEVPGDIVDRLLGQAGKSVRKRPTWRSCGRRSRAFGSTSRPLRLLHCLLDPCNKPSGIPEGTLGSAERGMRSRAAVVS